MSNVLAIAAVTQLLKDLLNDTLINGDVSTALGADFSVTALPPDRVVSDAGDQATQLNLFLYGVSPNAALRNDDLPTRGADGTLKRRPRLALDLHFILTAVSAEELHAEILLGYAMQLFHEQPILGRERIRAALEAAVIDQILPQQFDPVRASELADQLELLKITPNPLTMDDMSKLWTAFQTSYRTSVAYDVSLVLIERDLPVRSPLPVLSRGGLTDPASGRDPGVLLRPGLLGPLPVLASARSGDGHPVMRLGGTVEIAGMQLAGEAGAEVTVRFAEPGGATVLSMAPEAPAAPNRLVVRLPGTAPIAAANPAAGGATDPASWRIGPYIIDVAILGRDGRLSVSNALTLALAPASAPSATGVPAGVEIAMSCAPPIRPGQNVAILAGQSMAVLPSPAAPQSSASAIFAELASGTQVPVRLRVDGIDSPVIDLGANPPVLTTVAIP